MRRLVDCIIKVVGDPESMKNTQLLNETISAFNEQRFEWGNLLQENSGSNYREGFYNFMKSVENVELMDDEIDKALDYLHGHLEGEVGLWKEVEVKETLKDWRLSQKVVTAKPVPFVDVDSTMEVQVSESSATTCNTHDIAKKRNELKDKVRFMSSSEAKDLLREKIAKEGDSILDTLLQHV